MPTHTRALRIVYINGMSFLYHTLLVCTLTFTKRKKTDLANITISASLVVTAAAAAAGVARRHDNKKV